MNRNEALDAAKVLQHYADGGEVQYRLDREEEWKDGMPLFNFAECAYRIKPKPIDVWAIMDADNTLRGGSFSSREEAKSFASCLTGSAPFRIVCLIEATA